MTKPKTLGVIAARGGSKGLPGKNVADLGGKPLIAWSIIAAAGASELERTIVSSDNDEILQAARSAGGDVPFQRPASLASDDSKIEDVLVHALDELDEAYDWIVLLQATSPFRTSEDIDAGITFCRRCDAPALVAVCRSAKSPHWMYELDQDRHLKPVMQTNNQSLRRQLLPDVYIANGALYVAQTDWLRDNKTFYSPDTIAFEMPPERSIDIDSPFDLSVARGLLSIQP